MSSVRARPEVEIEHKEEDDDEREIEHSEIEGEEAFYPSAAAAESRDSPRAHEPPQQHTGSCLRPRMVYSHPAGSSVISGGCHPHGSS